MIDLFIIWGNFYPFEINGEERSLWHCWNMVQRSPRDTLPIDCDTHLVTHLQYIQGGPCGITHECVTYFVLVLMPPKCSTVFRDQWTAATLMSKVYGSILGDGHQFYLVACKPILQERSATAKHYLCEHYKHADYAGIWFSHSWSGTGMEIMERAYLWKCSSFFGFARILTHMQRW